MFRDEVKKHLDHYVYRLIDPRNAQTFYVGKGQGNRVFAHAKGEPEKNSDGNSDPKLQRIHEIKNDGFEVDHIIHRHGLDEGTAFEVESALIDAYPEVLNKAGGRNPERGSMHTKQVIKQYEAKETVFKHKVLMLNINHTASEADSIYEAVRYAWPLSKKNVKEVEYVLAVVKGLVVGVFKPTKWLEATKDNFPGRGGDPKKLGFEGVEAPDDIKKIYIGTRVPDRMRKKGAAAPVRYSD